MPSCIPDNRWDETPNAHARGAIPQDRHLSSEVAVEVGIYSAGLDVAGADDLAPSGTRSAFRISPSSSGLGRRRNGAGREQLAADLRVRQGGLETPALSFRDDRRGCTRGARTPAYQLSA